MDIPTTAPPCAPTPRKGEGSPESSRAALVERLLEVIRASGLDRADVVRALAMLLPRLWVQP